MSNHSGIGDPQYFLVTRRERTSWLAGIIFAFGLMALYGWMAQRPADARATDTQIVQRLARAKCDQPDLPLEKLVGPVASQLSGDIECAYITAPLGMQPRVRVTRARIAAAQ